MSDIEQVLLTGIKTYPRAGAILFAEGDPCENYFNRDSAARKQDPANAGAAFVWL